MVLIYIYIYILRPKIHLQPTFFSLCSSKFFFFFHHPHPPTTQIHSTKPLTTLGLNGLPRHPPPFSLCSSKFLYFCFCHPHPSTTQTRSTKPLTTLDLNGLPRHHWRSTPRTSFYEVLLTRSSRQCHLSENKITLMPPIKTLFPQFSIFISLPLRWRWGGDEVAMKWRWGGTNVENVSAPPHKMVYIVCHVNDDVASRPKVLRGLVGWIWVVRRGGWSKKKNRLRWTKWKI